MEESVSVVLLDDGELDRVRVILERMGAEFVLCRRPGASSEVPIARDLLVCTGRRALELGKSEAARVADGARWLCIHGQDFGELRARLRALGVHYLVHPSVDQETLRLLVAMLLHDRDERRTTARLPLGGEARLTVHGDTHAAKLVELSPTAARLRVEAPLEAGDWISLELPPELRGAALDALSGHVARAEREAGAKQGMSIAVELDPLPPDATAELEAILSGAHPGTRVSALSDLPVKKSGDRRRSPRRAYRRRVAALTKADAEAPQVVLGHDLSAEGIRIARQPGLALGQRIALGLYGTAGGAPLVLEAEIVRDHGARGFGLVFRDLGAEQKAQLEELVETLVPLESLDTQTRIIVSRVLEPQKP
ncbi:MAG TPA: PilZ domain-containing protein [Myxococcota bacterium]|nr:PilZ domain-containing protein [Myxococcota bacterium]